MTIYMTPNNLDGKIDSGEYDNARFAEVFVAVFTCNTSEGVTNSDGTTTYKWYQIGDIYEGYCPLVSYDGGNSEGSGSFVTDDWIPIDKTYRVTENYSYDLTEGDGRGDGTEDIKEILPVVDAAAYNEFTRLYGLANDAIEYIEANEDYFNIEEYKEPIKLLREVTQKAGNMGATNRTPRSELILILKELENAIYPFNRFVG